MDKPLPPDAPMPRLCHLIKWPDFDGFGFNLQQGHFIGKVDEDSPAEWAHLKENDVIIEVNGVPISNENHKQVVSRIKAVPNETHLLVIDKREYAWYEQRKLIIRASQANVVHYKTPVPRPANPIRDDDPPTMNGENDENAPELANTSTASTPTHSKESNNVSSNASTPNTSLEHRNDHHSPKSIDRQTDSPLADEILKELASKENHVDEVANKLKSTKLQSEASTIENNNNSEKAANQNLVSSPIKKNVPGKTHNFIVVDSEAEFAEEKRLKEELRSSSSSTPIRAESAERRELNHNHLHLNLSTSSNSMANNSSSNNLPATTGNPSAASPPSNMDINLNMSAQEMRKLIASRRNVKAECKKVPMDLRQKYEIIQQM